MYLSPLLKKTKHDEPGCINFFHSRFCKKVIVKGYEWTFLQKKTWILEIAVGGFGYVVRTSVSYHANETTRRALRAKGLLAEI